MAETTSNSAEVDAGGEQLGGGVVTEGVKPGAA
jgi:hypothetical protein